jgi:hypothetical protein
LLPTQRIITQKRLCQSFLAFEPVRLAVRLSGGSILAEAAEACNLPIQPAQELLLVLRAKEGDGEAFGLCSVYEPRLLIPGTNVFLKASGQLARRW